MSTCSELFRQRWASQDVRLHRSGPKRVRHPVVGRLDLDVDGVHGLRHRRLNLPRRVRSSRRCRALRR
ncbi:hypothetical protein ACFQ9Z_34175 [Streptomyces sp. NPDC056580]|uniref:MmyB family transcriptional regulator n=1 Tax=Streptomyces sp. NPDC056580 TaxID=3345872 RepID=UPI0036A2877A